MHSSHDVHPLPATPPGLLSMRDQRPCHVRLWPRPSLGGAARRVAPSPAA